MIRSLLKGINQRGQEQSNRFSTVKHYQLCVIGCFLVSKGVFSLSEISCLSGKPFSLKNLK